MASVARFQTRFWLRSQGEALTSSTIAAALAPGTRYFRIHLRVDECRAKVRAVFALKPLPSRQGTGPVHFAWSPADGGGLPSMRGTIGVRHFGPFANLTVHAGYRYDDGPAGRLFHEAVGEKLGKVIFANLLSVLKRTIADVTEAPMIVRDGSELSKKSAS
jgi:hypothetical protein